MELNSQKYYAKIVAFDEKLRTVDVIVIHFGKANENRWMPMIGCLDDFLIRLSKAKKFIPVVLQHDDSMLIGQFREWETIGDAFKGRIYLDDIPLVRDTVVPQLKSGTLQGTSPEIAPIRDSWNQETGMWEIIEGALCHVALVGLPADLKADILSVQASIQAQQNKDFEIELLTL